MSSTVARTIASQIGNRAFVMMGAKDLVGSDDALQFRVGRNPKGVNKVIVRYVKYHDLYEVECYKVKKLDHARVSYVNYVPCDSLRAIIERDTGIYLNL